MKKSFVYKFLSYILCSLLFGNCLYAQRDSLLNCSIQNSSVEMVDIKFVKSDYWNSLYRVPKHPAADSMLTPEIEAELLEQINHRKNLLGDTLRTSDMITIWKPYFAWLHYIDPHYDILTTIPFPVSLIKNNIIDYKDVSANKARDLQVKAMSTTATILAIETIRINDTLIVTASKYPSIKKGDVILSINDIPVETLFDYDISRRYTSPYTLLMRYYYHGFDKEYDIELIQNRKKTRTSVKGNDNCYWQIYDLEKQIIEPKVRYFDDAKAGYVRIPKFFPNNSKVISDLRKNINKFKKKGCTSVVVDLRNNPGGSGHAFDDLLSIFIDKPEIPYNKASWLKVSEETKNDYDFITEDMMGKRIRIPDYYLVKSLPLKSKKHIAGIQYYVLMDEGTASTAAALCNILQYNDGALLVGEPLLHNAFRFGDVIDGRSFIEETDDIHQLGLLVESGISTTENDCYTKANNGVLMPDILIPYTVKDYSEGEDGMLEKLLERLIQE